MENLTALASNQHYPTGALYVVATPIGNVADISLRALYILQLVDMVACEDTRNTGVLLTRYGIHKPLLAAHDHNEQSAAQKIVTHLQQGARIALVSDAGTPGISDPGARIVTAVRTAGLLIVPLPGACAALSALSVSGSLLDNHGGAFSFIGFLPSKTKQRENALRALVHHPYPLVLYEAPHRIRATLVDLAKWFPAQRPLFIGRELTKLFETITVTTVGAGVSWLDSDAQNNRGEFVLIIAGVSEQIETTYDVDQLLRLLSDDIAPAGAARIAAALTGVARDVLYARALALKQPSLDE
ncbi:MAG: 16S rRNA (cytidine(1402)-2'-O)-methyltransferase [Ottowia sp.]|nr:16S rRNA (cytidine(1402)-2'-O)-methyltransferase [Ottowia sp.]